MKKTFVMTAVAVGIMTLATGTNALASEMNLTAGSTLRTTGSDVVVMPGTASNELQLHFSGAERLHNEFHGGLTVFEAAGGRMYYRPDAYQLINGKRKPVEVSFHIDGKDLVTVQFGKTDKSAPIILERGAIMFQRAWM
jgi:hypothetical protein